MGEGLVKYSKYIGLFLILIFPISVLAFGKPLKILVPEVSGVECFSDSICIDDVSKLEEARRLYEQAAKEVSIKLSPLNNSPKIVFCSTPECFTSFGFNKQAGVSIASIGVIIGPRGWKGHYLTHELIHQWQSQEFGFLSTWLAPAWVKEGMAYHLSDDPRELLSEPFQMYRNQFKQEFGALRGMELKLRVEEHI